MNGTHLELWGSPLSTLVEPAQLPADRSEVTERWLVSALASHPSFSADPIESASLQPLGDGSGQLSTLILADLGLHSGATRQLVVKLHANVPDMHELALRYEHYDSEVNFYRQMADAVPLRTPEIYAARIDRDTERVLLIMESFADWHLPDQIEGATLEEVTIATEQLAGLTATFWNAPVRERFPWLRTLKSKAYESLASDYVDNTKEAMERLHGALPRGAASAAHAIGASYPAVMEELCVGNQALSHWDYRVENLFYGPNGEFAVIDWQLMMFTNPATDLAYLLSSNIDVELRRRSEDELMARFLEGLARHGVPNYGRNDLERDLRKALLGVSCIPIIGGANFDLDNERSHALSEAIFSRMFQAIEDWEALKLLP